MEVVLPGGETLVQCVDMLVMATHQYTKHKGTKFYQELHEYERCKKRSILNRIRLESYKSNANVMLMSRAMEGGREGGGECQVGDKVWLESELPRQQANGQWFSEQ